ncbi:acetyl-CoA carboxylase biotin carboxylase subunit [Ruminiclostridium cellulolyticum]|uniref:biotin carboxylase n=1 Tax=Ruminiclostridium cellulolyticum (strain ATCC 35319 / DSM 5812 / JCM 6584 / H10) TaxID=394503 RepID=B8I8R5_RUMCH|nr:biotin carboxylase N-terminal domain-containing protein [Ruminiclostridium cellulolyticum]ACL75298.1 Carbamoyl-phosphate synthase L chain ATP-binding [Ruminiclostridium cellulolyticum H10]
MIKKVLVANRGEIAVRIFRTLREMEISTVAVYSDDDRDSIFVRYADYSYPLEGNSAKDTYMNIEKIIKIAIEAKVDAIHPGYGFLSEKEEFAKAVEDAGLIFIGPSAQVIKLLGNKFEARTIAERLSIPLIPGLNRAINNIAEAEQIASSIGYPVMIKPAAGGGGKGMYIAKSKDELKDAFFKSQSMAESIFHNDSVFIERYYTDVHHIEVQLLADKYGNVVHLGERECSIQRRFQKIVEEAPCLTISQELKNEIFEYAVSIAKEVHYTGAGTVEFLYSNGEVFFLELNTRIQVEHAVTEMVTDIDIVKMQVLIAAGNELPINQNDISFKGHAIECRIYSEDIKNGFMPSSGAITYYQAPDGMGIRVDSGIAQNSFISHYYDSMIAKLIVKGNTRQEAICRMSRALDEFIIEGVKTDIDYLKAIMKDTSFINLEVNTDYLKEKHEDLIITTEKTKPGKKIHNQQNYEYYNYMCKQNEKRINYKTETMSLDSKENLLQQFIDEISMPSELSIDG